MDASPNNPADKVRQLQRELFVCAKRNRKRRFHALYDRICRGDVLAEAWKRVEANKGAAGIDGETLSMIEPIFEADFKDSSHGFRPKRSATDALEAIRLIGGRGHRYVVEIDIRKYCSAAVGQKRRNRCGASDSSWNG